MYLNLVNHTLKVVAVAMMSNAAEAPVELVEDDDNFDEFFDNNIEISHGEDAVYLGALGLYVNPFSLVADEKFYFESPAMRQRMQTLLHMIESNNGLICVVSDEGGGKTSFLHRFTHEAGEKWQLHEISISNDTSSLQILNSIAASIGANVLKKENKQIEKIVSHLSASGADQSFPVILFDNGHQLGAKAISALLKLKRKIAKKKLKMSTVVFADRNIKNTLNHKLLRNITDEWTYSIYLPRLSEKDTAEYLYHRLITAGMLIDKPFKPADVNAIYKIAKGLPRKTNEVAHRLLMCNYGGLRPVTKFKFGWLGKIKSISNENKIHIVMGLVLMVMLTSVGSGGPGPANASSAVVAHNAQAINSAAGMQNKTPGLSATDFSTSKEQPVALKSKAPASIDADCDATIFLDCGKPAKDAIKHITYR